LKAIPSLDFVRPVPTKRSLTQFGGVIQKVYRNLIQVVNGRIGYGDGVHSDNIDGIWVSVTFALANTDTLITHNLGRLPVGYHVMTKSASCDVYTGGVASTDTQITLRGTVAGVTVNLFIL